MIPDEIRNYSDSGHETEEQAWSALLVRTIPLIYGIYVQRGIHPALAEELTQKTVFDAVRGRTAYNPLKGTLEQWVLGIAHKNLAMDRRRRAGRVKAAGQLANHLNQLEQDLLPDELLERKETGQRVRQAMAELPAKERSVLEYKYLQDLTAREIAGRLEITEKAVHSLLYRARVQLRDRLRIADPLLKEGRRP